MFSFCLSHPLDIGWEFLQKANDFADKLSVDSEHNRITGCITLDEFQQDHRNAKKMWKKETGNTIDPEFCLLWFPDDCGYLNPAFIAKDYECNGMTFIFSSVNLAVVLENLIGA